MIKFIRRVAEWGNQPDTPFAQAQHNRLTNVLLLFMFVGSIFQTIFCFISGAIDAAILNSTAPFVFGSGLLLMRAGKTTLARYLVITISVIAGYAVVASLGPDSYFQIIFVFASAFMIVFFSLEEKYHLAIAMFVPLALLIHLEVTGYKPVMGMARAQFAPNELIFIRIGSLGAIWLLMVFHFFYFIRDRRKSQEQLVISAKMAALGRMAAGIAHEVNNPLQLILNHTERLRIAAQSKSATPEQLTTIANQIQAVVMRIGSINKGLLSLSRDSAEDPFTQVSVQSILKLSLDYCRAHLESKQVEFRMDPIPRFWTVIGRETQLSEVILNVLNNSYYAILKSPQKWIQIQVSAATGWIEISVTDSGDGVDPKLVHRIFDPFFTTKPVGEGAGLGLSISQNIMAVHGGQIYYDEKSAGARFVVRIPRGADAVI